MRRESQIVHFDPSPGDPHSPSATPIYQTATFRQPSAADLGDYDYTRSGNPTRDVLETLLARIESGVQSFAFASGMAAISAVVSLLEPGDEVVGCSDLYGGTYRYLTKIAPGQGIRSRFVDTTDCEALAESLNDRTRLLLIETPTNPMLRITDLREASKIAKDRGCLVAVDNSLMSPLLQCPLTLGADLVIHSATKYLSGHSDVMAGVVVTGSSAIGQRLAFYQNAAGTALSPFDSWLLLRGIKTLALRLERQQSNAGRIARYLTGHPLGFEVHYPGLGRHPRREVHFSQCEGSGGVVSFEAGSADLATKLVELTEMFEVTVSFGGVVSSIGIPALMSHASIPTDAGDVQKVPPDLVRVSAGIEHPDDLIEDLDKALALAIQATRNTL